MLARLLLSVSPAILLACGGGNADDCGDGSCDCTAEARGVSGASLTIDSVDLVSFQCTDRLLTSAADVAAAFPAGDAPPQVANANFAIDRVVLATSNPALEFAVDDGAKIVVGEEPLCQGAAPSCVAYIVHGTTRNVFEVAACPYRGPDPCLAP